MRKIQERQGNHHWRDIAALINNNLQALKVHISIK